MAPRILIADDEENQRRLYAQEFLDEGYEVAEAADGCPGPPTPAS